MTKQPHANNPNATSNNDPAGNTFGEFLSDPMTVDIGGKRYDAYAVIEHNGQSYLAYDLKRRLARKARRLAAQYALDAALDAHFAR